MRFYKFFISIFLIFTVCFYITTPVFSEETTYVWSPNNNSLNDSTNDNSSQIKETNSEVNESNSLSLESGSAILIEQTTGQVLYSHNAHEQLRPASVTKVMSILLIMEALDSNKISLTDSVPCSDTCFKNCHGLDEDGHVTSAYDISLMSRELLNNHPSVTNYTTIWTDTLRNRKI